MARMHILEQSQPNLYNVIVHAPTPAGNYAARLRQFGRTVA